MQGIIAGGSPQTVEAGAAMLRRGGNAVDAAVAAAFASYMGEVMLATPGGGGYALVGGAGRDPVLYDFFCATPGLGEDRRGPEMDFAPVTVVYESGTSVYHLGRASSAVPGDVAGLAQLLAEAGTLPLDVVLEPAIRLAHDGYVLNKYQAYLIRLVDVIFNYDPACRRVYAPRGRWLEPGERLANPALGRTLEQIATDGPATFYTGALADAILADHRANGGLLTAEDLAAYRVIKRAPLRFDYRGRDVLTNPPPSAGGILIACALRLFGRADLAGLAHGDLDHVALLAEVQRQTTIARYRDRPVALPDAASWAAWLDDAARRADWTAIQAALAADSVRHGPDNPRGHASTTHISAIDETGLAVGLTTTPGETAGYFVDETGVLMNNMLGEEELSPDGFHVYEPGVRLSSMMAPTLVTGADGRLLVAGSGGAARLRTAIMQLLSNVLDWGLPLADAVEAPRYHFENDLLDLEGGHDPATADALERRGYTVSRWDVRAFYFGGTHIAQRDSDGSLSAAGDARRGGVVAVVAE